MRDTSLVPITAVWTGTSCVALVDGGSTSTPAVVQTPGSHWGYVDVPMGGDSSQVSISITNAGAKPVDVVLYAANVRAASGAPDDMDAAMMKLFARFIQRHNSDGTALRVYDTDGVTQLWAQAQTMSPLDIGQGF